MNSYDKKLEHITVIGAAGKMGSGIVLCILLYVAERILAGKFINNKPSLIAVDPSEKGLQDLISFLKSNLIKFAERRIISIRDLYRDNESLIENIEHIDFFIREMISCVVTTTRTAMAAESELIFEAIPEDLQLKTEILTKVAKLSSANTWIMTNTSSIPITELDMNSGLDGRIIGFHFYNPPAIQKLIEIIPSKRKNPELIEFASWFAKELGKTAVGANDVAGFLGNGMFIREISFVLKKISELQLNLAWEEAVQIMDVISKDFLIRPMGIIQLMDYVGLDICISIAHIMQASLHEDLDVSTLEKIAAQNILGGQESNGLQKDGILKYQKNHKTAIYNPGTEKYTSVDTIDANVKRVLNQQTEYPTWKNMRKERNLHSKLHKHFRVLLAEHSLGAQLSKEYLSFYKQTGSNLIDQKVVQQEEDVNKIMMLGFHHLYGPFNEYILPNQL